MCERNIRNGVYVQSLAHHHDYNVVPLEVEQSGVPFTERLDAYERTKDGPPSYPTIMEFELSNVCNLQCIMCNGNLSSGIRRDCEKLPPINSPYTEMFIDHLAEFIPYLERARFNGGEPFLHPICHGIWQEFLRVNPSIEITIATNGTVLNDQIRDIVEGGCFRLNISIDSVRKESCEAIRINARFEQTMENLNYFIDYAGRHNTYLTIMVNPMRINWREMPELVEFCNSQGVRMWFNTILRPPHLALWNLSASELENIYKELASKYESISSPEGIDPDIKSHNLRLYHNLVHLQIKSWWREQRQRESSKPWSFPELYEKCLKMYKPKNSR